MVSSVLNKLRPMQGRRELLRVSQSVGDIVTGILKTHNLYRTEYDKIAPDFDAPTTLQICRKIYDFLKKNTHYVVEPNAKQTLRSPAAILRMGGSRNIGLDCKSYSLFIGGVLDALNRRGKNISWCYRFASYRFNPLPHHVFVVVNPNTANEIWIDPVLPTFNNKKQYTHKIDRMALYSVSGIGRTKRTKEEKRARKKQFKAKIKEKLKKRGKLLLKFNPATATARNAFLLLTKLNMLGLARKIASILKHNPEKIKKFWQGIGGNFKSLEKNVATGIKKGKHKNEPINGVGIVVAAGTAAAVASATPIIIKIIKLFKENGINADSLIEAGKGVINEVVDKKIDDQAEALAEDGGDISDADQIENLDPQAEGGGDYVEEPQSNESEDGDEVSGIDHSFTVGIIF